MGVVGWYKRASEDVTLSWSTRSWCVRQTKPVAQSAFRESRRSEESDEQAAHRHAKVR